MFTHEKNNDLGCDEGRGIHILRPMWGILRFIAVILGFRSYRLAFFSSCFLSFFQRASILSPHSPEKNTDAVKVKGVLVSKWRYTPLLLLIINHCHWISSLNVSFILCPYFAVWGFTLSLETSLKFGPLFGRPALGEVHQFEEQLPFI